LVGEIECEPAREGGSSGSSDNRRAVEMAHASKVSQGREREEREKREREERSIERIDRSHCSHGNTLEWLEEKWSTMNQTVRVVL
jgi:hypothetical protein